MPTTNNLFNYYNTNTTYQTGDIVLYGNNIYQAVYLNQGVPPVNSSSWTIIYSNFDGMSSCGVWNNSAQYLVGQYVTYNNVAYIAISNNTNIVPGTDTTKWVLISPPIVISLPGDIQYQGANTLTRLPIGNTNQILTVSSQGYPAWSNAYPNGTANQVLTLNSSKVATWVTPFSEVPTANVYYVATNGVDAANRGTTINTPFASVKYAAQNVPTNSTIIVKSGTYNETLPITVPQGVSIVGDSIRATIIQPASGNTGTMFYLSDSTMVSNLTVKGMTGFSCSSNTVTSATLSGVFFALNPSSQIINKSPYIKDVSMISSGGIGALVDGSVHASGNKSMLFDGVTCINDGGAGLIAINSGRMEIVSTFTYYCYFGIAGASGATIRTMGCNNAYGTYGVAGDGSTTIVRLNAHEFMSIGTGGITTTNYPGSPTQQPNLNNQVIKTNNASVYFVSMDESDNLSVGPLFKVTSSNGSITAANTINASVVNTTNVNATTITASGITASGNMTVSGNLSVQGTTTTYNTEVVLTTEYANNISANSITVNNISTIHGILETANVQSSAAGGTMAIRLSTASVFYYTSSSTSNMTLNFIYDGVSSLNSVMSVGQSLSSAILVTQGGTAYYPSTIQIDGTTVTTKWAGGTAPVSGDANSINVYTFSIVKTGNATYTVLASSTKFA